MYSTASDLYKDLLGIYFDKYYKLPNAKRKKIDSKYDPDKLFFTRIEWWRQIYWFPFNTSTRRWLSKRREKTENLNSKQTINYTSNIVSTNKIWKQLIQIKKLNQTNILSFVSA